jgi:putative transposase
VPRPPRLRVPGGIHHITARGNRRQPIFLEDADRRFFLRLFECVADRSLWRCFSYCLMPNHYHLVVETVNGELSTGMHRLNSGYAHHFNECHGLDGHLFEDRYHSVLVDSDWHLLELSRYLALNPVRAGLCGSPVEWPWSSYAALAGEIPPPRFLAVERVLAHFGGDRSRAQSNFRSFLHDAAPTSLSL